MDLKDIIVPITGKVTLGLPQVCEFCERWTRDVRKRMEKDAVHADGDEGNRQHCGPDLKNPRDRVSHGRPYRNPEIGLHVSGSSLSIMNERLRGTHKYSGDRPAPRTSDGVINFKFASNGRYPALAFLRYCGDHPDLMQLLGVEALTLDAAPFIFPTNAI
jgi:hypothetical protein